MLVAMPYCIVAGGSRTKRGWASRVGKLLVEIRLHFLFSGNIIVLKHGRTEALQSRKGQPIGPAFVHSFAI